MTMDPYHQPLDASLEFLKERKLIARPISGMSYAADGGVNVFCGHCDNVSRRTLRKSWNSTAAIKAISSKLHKCAQSLAKYFPVGVVKRLRDKRLEQKRLANPKG